MSPSGSILGVEKIVDNGPGRTRWDLIILGDGYQRDEIAKYEQDVAGVVAAILAAAPFDALQNAINIHRVNVASDESGAGDLCTGVRKATYFDSNFCAEGVDRLLVADDLRALDVARDAVPQMNATLMVVNSETYGGSGGAVPVFSRHPDAHEIALHELGHSPFLLADEYPSRGDCAKPGDMRYTGDDPDAPNITSRLDPLKWSTFLTPGVALPTTTNANCNECDSQPSPVADDTVGAFDGAGYFRCGLYRPQYDCRMRTLGKPFCVVCQDAIRRVLDPYLRRRPSRS